MRPGIAVREIDPDDIAAGPDQLLQGFGIIGGRPEGGDDLGSTIH
jgi:hypothetical protein